MKQTDQPRRALGKGLSALLPSKTARPVPSPAEVQGKPQYGVLTISIEEIEPNPLQPRSAFEPERLAELAQSIRSNGIIQPLVVIRKDNRYQLVAGERRWRAAKLAGLLTRIDAINDLYADIPAEITGISGGDGNLGLRVSLNAGTVEAGGVRSLIPTRARAQIDVRLPPGITGAEIERKVRLAAENDPDITVKAVKAWDANWTALANPLVAELRAAATAVRGAAPQFVVRLPGSDARRWRDLGVPAACYGPQPTLSAGVDDYAGEQDVLDCARVYARTAVRLMQD